VELNWAKSISAFCFRSWAGTESEARLHGSSERKTVFSSLEIKMTEDILSLVQLHQQPVKKLLKTKLYQRGPFVFIYQCA
jgi:hypothetical protein